MSNRKPKSERSDAPDTSASRQSGRTVGKMQRKSKTTPSSERRGLRAKNQYKPSGKARFPFGHSVIPANTTPPTAWRAMGEAASRRAS